MKPISQLLIFAFAINSIQAGCEICLNKKCYSQTLFRSGIQGDVLMFIRNPVIYFNDNILYHVNNFDFSITAFHLNDGTEHRFLSEPTASVTVDQNTGEVYYNPLLNAAKLYKVSPKTNEKVLIADITANGYDNQMWFNKGRLYFTKLRGWTKGLRYLDEGKVKSIPAFANYSIESVLFDKNDSIYAHADDGNTYRLKKDDVHLIKVGCYLCSMAVDRNGDVFFVERYKREMYKLGTDDNLELTGLFHLQCRDIIFDEKNDILCSEYYEQYTYLKKDSDKCRFTWDDLIGVKTYIKEIDVVETDDI